MRTIVVLAVLLLVGCSEEKSRPLQFPVTVGPSAVPAPTGWTLAGTVVSTQTAQPVRGATIAPFGVTTNEAGAFSVSATEPRAPRLTIDAPGYLTRSTSLSTGTEQPRFDLISLSGFSLDFYRAFVRNGYDNPHAHLPIYRWTQVPSLYIRRIDEAGQPVDSSLMALVERIAREVPTDWGDRFRIATIETGPETREGQAGWITVKWLNPPVFDYCGRAQSPVNTSTIEINHKWDRCDCLLTTGATVRHEMGHAFGFFHTGSSADVMAGLVTACSERAARPSARERAHAAIAYTRPVGNTDPDNDPVGQAFSMTGDAPVIVD